MLSCCIYLFVFFFSFWSFFISIQFIFNPIIVVQSSYTANAVHKDNKGQLMENKQKRMRAYKEFLKRIKMIKYIQQIIIIYKIYKTEYFQLLYRNLTFVVKIYHLVIFMFISLFPPLLISM